MSIEYVVVKGLIDHGLGRHAGLRVLVVQVITHDLERLRIGVGDAEHRGGKLSLAHRLKQCRSALKRFCKTRVILTLGGIVTEELKVLNLLSGKASRVRGSVRVWIENVISCDSNRVCSLRVNILVISVHLIDRLLHNLFDLIGRSVRKTSDSALSKVSLGHLGAGIGCRKDLSSHNHRLFFCTLNSGILLIGNIFTNQCKLTGLVEISVSALNQTIAFLCVDVTNSILVSNAFKLLLKLGRHVVVGH